MAIDTISPVQSSVINPGDSVSFLVDDTWTSMVIQVQAAAGLEAAFSGGVPQPGYTVSITNAAGRDTFVVSRAAGWNKSPQQVIVTEDESGGSTQTTLSWFLSTTSVYSQGYQPYNAVSTGSLIVSEDDVVTRSDVGQIDFDDATFNVTDLGNGKVGVAAIAAGGMDSDAIHDNVANEISALTLKSIVSSGDHFIIEDIDAANVKKRTAPAHINVNILNSAGAALNDVPKSDGASGIFWGPATDTRSIHFSAAQVLAAGSTWYSWGSTNGFNAENWSTAAGSIPGTPTIERITNGWLMASAGTLTKVKLLHTQASGSARPYEFELWKIAVTDGDEADGTKTKLASISYTSSATANHAHLKDLTLDSTTLAEGDMLVWFAGRTDGGGSITIRVSLTLEWTVP